MSGLRLTDETRLRDDIVALGRSLFSRGLTAGSSGNISVRLSGGGWLMTPTNASLGSLEPHKLSKLDEAGRLTDGPPPTKEAFLHRAMYAERPQASAIVHLHATYSAAVSCMEGLDCDNCLPPLTPYFVMKIGRLPLLPYHRPGDPALGPLISRHACRHCAVLLANHGPVVSGTTLENAGFAIEELEETAKLFLLLRNVPTRPLTCEQVADLDATFKLGLDA
jgi:ribulose-5-phosphate 4-epimerase/fuculose-1-phosphate aldolase